LYLPTNTKYIFGLPTPNIFLANQYQIYSWLTNTKYILGLPSPNIFLAYQHQIYFVWKKTKFLQCRFLAHSSFNNVYMCFCYFVQLYSGSKLPVFFKIFPHHVWREVKCQAEGFCIFQLRCNILTELKKKKWNKGGWICSGRSLLHFLYKSFSWGQIRVHSKFHLEGHMEVHYKFVVGS